jgi:hypothetical protein
VYIINNTLDKTVMVSTQCYPHHRKQQAPYCFFLCFNRQMSLQCNAAAILSICPSSLNPSKIRSDNFDTSWKTVLKHSHPLVRMPLVESEYHQQQIACLVNKAVHQAPGQTKLAASPLPNHKHSSTPQGRSSLLLYSLLQRLSAF